jgi:hypothetical protein
MAFGATRHSSCCGLTWPRWRHTSDTRHQTRVCVHSSHPVPCHAPVPRMQPPQETLRELPPLLASGFWPNLKAVKEGRVVMVDGNAMFNRPGPRLVDCFEFLVGLLHNRHDVIPQGYPWRFLGKDDLAAEVSAWLETHPGWATRVQQGPKPREDGQAAAVSMCCGPQGCVPAPAPAAAAAACATPAATPAAAPAGEGC